jgi:single-strand DNA-binding protein
MSSAGLNKWIVSGRLAADAEIKTVDLKSGERAKVAKATIYVRKSRSREEAFTVALSIWEGATAWRKLPFLKKGSLIICTGSVEPNPYLSNSDNLPRAGLTMNVLDVDLDSIRHSEEAEAESLPLSNSQLPDHEGNSQATLPSVSPPAAPTSSQTSSPKSSPAVPNQSASDAKEAKTAHKA